MSSLQYIHLPKPDITVYTDSIKLGWGVTDRINRSRDEK